MSTITLQLADPVMAGIQKLAQQRKMTVEALLEEMASDAVKQNDWWDERAERGGKVTRERFLEILNKAPNLPPIPGDELP